MTPRELCSIHVDFDRKLPKIVVVTCLMGGHDCVFRPIRKMFEETSMSFEPLDILSATPAPTGLAKTASELFLPRPLGIYSNYVKRLVDVTLVLLAAPIVLVVVLVIAALILLQDGRSPFYWSMRVGRNGRIFRMLKLRSMVPDADERLADYLATDPEAAFEWKTTQKLKTDPRITRLGRVLRKSSLDELPQLWNVLIGAGLLCAASGRFGPVAGVGPQRLDLCTAGGFRPELSPHPVFHQ
jgi:hypothetical protein